MARVWFEGFDNQNNGTDIVAGVLSGLASLNGGFQLVTGRYNGGKAFELTCSATGWCIATKLMASAVSIGFSHQNLQWAPATTTTPFLPWLAFYDSAAGLPQICILFDVIGGIVSAYRGWPPGVQSGGGTLLGSSAAGKALTGTWFACEIGSTISATIGTAVVEINGVAVLALTNQNTKNSANSTFDTLYWGITSPAGSGALNALVVDDCYFGDSSGSAPFNGFIGPSAVVTRFATAAVAAGFTPAAGANVSQIQETAMDGDASYNFSDVPAAQDLFVDSSAWPAGFVPLDFKVQRASRAEIAATRSGANVANYAGTTSVGATAVETVGYGYYEDYFGPGASLWGGGFGVSAILASAYGYKVIS